jgi:hypothetical protein
MTHCRKDMRCDIHTSAFFELHLLINPRHVVELLVNSSAFRRPRRVLCQSTERTSDINGPGIPRDDQPLLPSPPNTVTHSFPPASAFLEKVNHVEIHLHNEQHCAAIPSSCCQAWKGYGVQENGELAGTVEHDGAGFRNRFPVFCVLSKVALWMEQDDRVFCQPYDDGR